MMLFAPASLLLREKLRFVEGDYVSDQKAIGWLYAIRPAVIENDLLQSWKKFVFLDVSILWPSQRRSARRTLPWPSEPQLENDDV